MSNRRQLSFWQLVTFDVIFFLTKNDNIVIAYHYFHKGINDIYIDENNNCKVLCKLNEGISSENDWYSVLRCTRLYWIFLYEVWWNLYHINMCPIKVNCNTMNLSYTLLVTASRLTPCHYQRLVIPQPHCSELRYCYAGLNLVLLVTWFPKQLQVKRD